jgi:3-deoxy-D-manno-octulosonic acid hydroxylase-like protein
MIWLTVDDYGSGGWTAASDAVGRARHYCSELEKGAILIFSAPPFALPRADLDFLTSLHPAESRLHKHISYRPEQDRLRGFAGDGSEARVHGVMRRYAAETRKFVAGFLTPYAGKFQMDYASFRAFEEEGRGLPVRKKNALLHVDAFPSRPTRGARILRVFTNIHPLKDRVWEVAGSFPELAAQFANQAGPRGLSGRAGVVRSIKRGLSAMGLPVHDRTPYDEFMLRFHDWLKENTAFQTAREGKERRQFPPLTSWLVFTDGLPHAVVSGQSAMEQTFLIPVEALVAPEAAPIRALERIAGRALS